eukprot:2445713-Amphidinium_carterae.1
MKLLRHGSASEHRTALRLNDNTDHFWFKRVLFPSPACKLCKPLNKQSWKWRSHRALELVNSRFVQDMFVRRGMLHMYWKPAINGTENNWSWQ